MSELCVIFDLDGTLVDSETICMQVLADLLPECSAPVEQLLHRYRGESLSSIFQDIEKRLSRKLPLNFEALYRATLSRRFAQGLKPMPGVLPMLRQMKHRRCIASGGPSDKIIQTLDLSGLAPYFGTNLFSSYDLASFKPDPGLFLHAARKMGFEPRQCVVVEDSLVGIQAAKAAGMVALLYSPSPSDHRSGADVTITDMEDLSSILSGFNGSSRMADASLRQSSVEDPRPLAQLGHISRPQT